MHLRRLCLSLAAFGALSLTSFAPAAAASSDDNDLPETLRHGYVGPIVGPANDRAYAHGALSLVRPSYGRASLYVAWRVMHLPPGAVAKESHTRRGDWLHGGAFPPSIPDKDEIATWLAARQALVTTAPVAEPSYYRISQLKIATGGQIDIETGQCGPDAFVLATHTLAELVADGTLRDTDRRTWIAGQDAVFARCAWAPGKVGAPALPAALPADAPRRMKALNEYQHAAALFYGDDFAAARREFDAIAAVADHPMRGWATLGGIRSVLRDAVRDTEWAAAVDEAYVKRQLRGAAFNAAVAEAARRHNARVSTALADLQTRTRAALADPTLAAVRAPITYTGKRAAMQLMPLLPLRYAMEALDRPEVNPYAMSALDLFQEMFAQIGAGRPKGELGTAMRAHTWFDFVMTVQGCSDSPQAVDAALCDSEHAHARSRWQETKENAWLLATLMTAREPTAEDGVAAQAAVAAAADRPEWASLQFHAARVLKAQGRTADARAALDALVASPAVDKRDRALVEAERRAL